MKNLIINADDFGYSEHTVDWTIKCFEAGVLSSATIMVGASSVVRAVSYAKKNVQWSFGLHLCLTDERPICRPADIPSLITPEGLFWPTRMFMYRSLSGLIRKEDLEREIRAQINLFRSFGITMSHLDGHGHMHRMPLVLKTLIGLGTEFGLKSLRPAQNLYYSRSRSILPIGRLFNQWMNRKLHANFKSPDHFLMTTGKVGCDEITWFRDMIHQLPDGCTEIGIHPGIDQEWRRLDTEFLLGSGAELLSRSDVQLSTYSRFRD